MIQKKFYFLLILFFVLIFSTSNSKAQNNALSFDGTGQYVFLDNAVLNNVNDWTFSAWVYPEGNSDMTVYSEGNPLLTFEISVTWDNKLHVGIWNLDHTPTWIHFYTSKNSIPKNQWTHIAVTLSGAGDEAAKGDINIYLNGDLSQSGKSYKQHHDETQYGAIARNVGSTKDGTQSKSAFRGKIDYMQISNQAISRSEIIKSMYDNSFAGYPNLLSFWNFDDGSGSNLNDISSKNNKGMLNDMDDSNWIKSTSPTGSYDAMYDDIASAWIGKQSNSSAELSVKYTNNRGDGFINFGHDNNNYQSENSTIQGIKKQIKKKWILNKSQAIQFISLIFNILDDLDKNKLAVIISTKDDFSSDISIWTGKVIESNKFEASVFISSEAEKYYCRLVETNSSSGQLSASIGFGPFIETYENNNTFTINNLPDGVDEVIFYFLQNNGSIIDSVDVKGIDMKTASCNYEMGFLPIGSHIFSKVIISGDQKYHLNYHEKITITSLEPHIYVTTPDSSGFYYHLGDSGIKTFHVDSLPPKTTKVIFEILDGQNNPVPNAKDSVLGDDIGSTKWHVDLKDYELTLSSILRVTIFHTGGLEEGSEYYAHLQIIAQPSVFSVKSFTNEVILLNYFGQKDGYLRTNNSLLNKLDKWTFQTWVNPWDYGDEHTKRCIYSEGNPKETFSINVTEDNSLSVGVWNEYYAGNWINVQTAANTVPNEEWTHLTVTLDGAGSNGKQGYLKIYINGELKKQEKCHRQEHPDTKYLNIARNVGSTFGGNQDSLPFRGHFDEIRIYDKLLSISEINENMWKQEYDFDHLLANWRFNIKTREVKCQVSEENNLELMNCEGNLDYIYKTDGYLHLLTENQTKWGPFITNNYSMTGAVPNGHWETVPPYNNEYTLKNLPPHTSKVSFTVLDDEEKSIHTADIKANGNSWLDSACFSFRMTDLPLSTRKLQADVFCVGGNEDGITYSHDIIAIQRPLKITKQKPDTLYAHRTMDKSLKFDGSEESQVNIMADSIDIGKEFTVEFWAKMMNYPEEKEHPVWHIGTSPRIGTYSLNPSYIGPIAELKTQNGDIIEVANDNYSTWKGWSHFALVCDGNKLILYVSNEVNEDVNESYKTLDSDPVIDLNSFGFAGNLEGSEYKNDKLFQGYLDELRVWNYARSHDEINQNRFKTLTKEDGLVLNWSINGPLTNKAVVYDESESGILGRINTGVSFDSDSPPLNKYYEEYVVQSSNTSTDSVFVDWLDKQGNIIKTDKSIYSSASYIHQDYNLPGDSLIAPFKHDLAEFPYTINRLGINAIFGDKNVIRKYDTVFNIVIYPAKPYVNASVGWSNFKHGAELWNHFHIDGFPEGTDKVIARIKNMDNNNTYDQITLTENGIPYKNSMYFDGTATMLTSKSYQNPKPFSIMLWFKTTTRKGGKLVGFSNNQNGWGDIHDRQLYMDDDGNLHFGVWGEHNAQVINSQYNYNDGLWHHVAVTFKDDAMIMYVDGGIVDMKTDNLSAGNYTGYWSIYGGKLSDSWPSSPSNEKFEGEITELSIWNTAIDYSTIGKYMHLSLDTDQLNSLVSYYKFDNINGSTIEDINGNNNGTIDGTTKLIVKHDFTNPIWTFDMSEIPVGKYSFNTEIFYPEGPDQSHNYILDYLTVDSPWESSDNANLQLESSGGFGYFVEGSESVCNFSLNSSFNYDHPHFYVKIAKGKFPSSRIISSKKVSFEGWPAHFSMDMGVAEPGSYLLIELSDKPKARYPLFVEPIGIPKVTGNLGPFDQSIAPGTMEQLNTFRIISYADELSHIKADFIDSFGNNMGDTLAKRVDDTTWTVTYDMAKLWPPETKMKLSYFLGNDPDPAIVQSDNHIKINRRRPYFFYRYADFSNVEIQADSVFFSIDTPYDKPNRKDLAEMTSTLPMFDGQDLIFTVPHLKADMKYVVTTNTLSFVEDPTINYSANILGGGDKNDQFDLVNENAHCDECYYYLIDEGVNKNELEAFRYKRKHHSFELPIFYYYDLIKEIKELVSDASDTSPTSLIAKPYWDFALGFEWGSDFQTHVGMDEHGYWGSIGGLEPESEEGDSTSHQYGVFGADAVFTIGIEFCLGIIGSIEVNLEGGYLFGLGDIHNSAGTYKNETLRSEEVELAISITAHELFGIFSEYIMRPKTISKWHGGDEIPENWPKVTVKAFGHDLKANKNDKAPSPLNGDYIDEVKYVTHCNPQPAIASDNNQAVSVWLEQDQASGVGTLLVAKFDSAETQFSAPKVVISNRNAISNPRVDLINKTTAIITWSQNRHTNETIPYGANLNDILASHDIWFAIYDIENNMIKQVSPIIDDFSQYGVGRMEGMADIAKLSDNKAMIVWIVADLENNSSYLYYSSLEELDGSWISSDAAKVDNIDGVQSKPRIVHINENEAELFWINIDNPDGDNSKIYSSIWNNTHWENSGIIDNAETGRYYKDIDIDSYNDYHLITWSSYLGADKSKNQSLHILALSPNFEEPFEKTITDSTGNIINTKASISSSGIASVIYQHNHRNKNNVFTKINLITKDLKNNQDWHFHQASELICDTSTQVKALDADFGMNNLLFIKSQELHNNNFNIHKPKNGVLFGMPKMKCVFRAVQINENLTLTDVDENNIVASINNREHAFENNSGISLRQNVPNPCSESTTIDFHLEKAANIKLDIVDISGNIIASPVYGWKEAGSHSILFNTENLTNGAYYYKLSTEGAVITRSMIVIR